METLTKENFWNDLQEKYPAGMKIFCEWIDKYKGKYGWNNLFGEHKTFYQGNLVCIGFAPKFHQLPYAMQIGIWLEFESEMSVRATKPFYYNHARKQIIAFIKDLHEESTD